MTKAEIEIKGFEMTTSLGLENKKAILFWKAFDKNKLFTCRIHLKLWELSLRK